MTWCFTCLDDRFATALETGRDLYQDVMAREDTMTTTTTADQPQ